MKRTRSIALGALLLASFGLDQPPALGHPYLWPTSSPVELRAPTDKISAQGLIGGCLQGGLVDLRYGQMSVDLGGRGQLLSYDDSSVFSLNGQRICPWHLSLEAQQRSLTVVARYQPETGLIGWADAYTSANEEQRAIRLKVSSNERPAYTPDDTIVVEIPSDEWNRISPQGKSVFLFVPGLTHELPFSLSSDGVPQGVSLTGWRDLDLVELPLMVRVGSEPRPTFWRGQRITLSSAGPSIVGFGPHRASLTDTPIRGWVDTESPSGLLDPRSIRLTASSGASLTSVQRRIGRTTFEVEADGAGTIWLECTVQDRLGRSKTLRWPLDLRP